MAINFLISKIIFVIQIHKKLDKKGKIIFFIGKIWLQP